MVPARPVRRVFAFALDYVLIAAYVVALAGITLLVLNSPLKSLYERLWRSPFTAELMGFVLLTRFRSSSTSGFWRALVARPHLVNRSSESRWWPQTAGRYRKDDRWCDPRSSSRPGNCRMGSSGS